MYDYKAPRIPTDPIYAPLAVQDFTLPKPINMLKPNRDSKGRITEGSIYYANETVELAGTVDAASARTTFAKGTTRIKATHAGKAIAIMAIPLKYVAFYGGQGEATRNLGKVLETRFRVMDYAFAYIMVTDDNDTSGVDYPSQSYGWSFYTPRSFFPSDSSSIPESKPSPTIINGDSAITGEYMTGADYIGNNFIKNLINYVNDQKSEYGVGGVEDEVLEVLQQAIDGGYYNGLQMSYLKSQQQTTGNGNLSAVFNRYSSYIATTIPVFGYDDFEAMKDYFDTGNTDGAMNQDYIDLSDVDLATDWTVYVRGARYPDIWVTMESKKLEEFLTDTTKNTTGLSKRDFKVQLRIPIDKLSIDRGPQEYQTSTYEYGEIIPLSWNNIHDINTKVNFVTNRNHAHFELRLIMPENIETMFSSWAYARLYYIGSPSIEGFAEGNNEAYIEGLNDGSTITIIYDQYPPDYPEYTTPDEDTDVEDTDPIEGGGLALNKLTTSYILTDAQLQQLGGFLWGASFMDSIKLVNNSPIENIVGCKIMPINLLGTPNVVKIGNVDTSVNGDIITSVPNVEVGSLQYDGYYHNFLDYAPFTDIQLFLPFIGFVSLDPAQVTGHNIKVIYAFDVIMGQCKAMLFVDNIYFMSYEGNCGVDVPLVASNRAQIEAKFVAGVVSDVVSGDIGGIANDFINTQYHYNRNGQYSPTLGWCETRNVYLVLAIPVSNYPSTYGHDYGYPCNLSFGLATLKGFTQVAPDVDVSGIPCTEEEREMIRAALVKGVYL